MKRKITILFSSIIALLALAGCSENEETISGQQTMFSELREIGIYIDGKAIISFDKYSYQTSRNAAGTLFRIQKDNLTKIAECRFSVNPSKYREVEATVTFTGTAADNISGTFKIIKYENGKCYLWNTENNCGLIIPSSSN